jgi:hypothetical protein
MTCNGQCVPVSSHWVLQFILTVNCELAVWFKNGVCCLYPGTTQAWFNQAVAAASPGHYIHQFLYKKMPYQLIRPPCPPPGIFNACCGNRLPATLHATIANVSGAACAATTIALDYDAGAQGWIGSGPLGSCGHPVKLTLTCIAPGGTCSDLTLTVVFTDGCALGGGQAPSSCACSPLSLDYTFPLPVPCGGAPLATMSITVTT